MQALSNRDLLTRWARTRAMGLPTDGLNVPFEFLLREIALSWHVAPPHMPDLFTYEDVERELITMQILAEAQPPRPRR